MNAIPMTIVGSVADPTGKYRCPLCRVQSAGDEADTGWVKCPMLRGQLICLGSCIDHQSAARAEFFQDHFDRDLFDQLAHVTQRTVDDLRLTCMSHQLEVIDQRLSEESPDEVELKRLQVSLRARMAELSQS